MEAMTAAQVAGMEGVVGPGVRCVRCGYELRGLRADGVCPECGGEIRRTLMGDLLMFADAGYVRTLKIGATLALAGIIAALCTVFGGVGLMMLEMTGSGGQTWLFPTVLGVGGLGFAAFTLVGWWLLSTPDPGRLGADTGVTSRKVVRAGVLMTLAGWTTSLGLRIVVSGVWGIWAAPGTLWVRQLTEMMIAVGWVGLVLQLFGAAAYMGHLAGRLRSAEIRKSARDVRNLTLGLLGAAGCAFAIIFLMWGNPIAALPGIVGYAFFALTAGRYASVVAAARREIGLAAAVIASEGKGEGGSGKGEVGGKDQGGSGA
jgi:hypothetical protein